MSIVFKLTKSIQTILNDILIHVLKKNISEYNIKVK
jgi:hypothetical protein